MNDQPVLIEREGGVATITLNRPEAANSIDMPLSRAFRDAAIACAQDDAVRCVVVTGAGKLFCAGGDIAGFEAAGAQITPYIHELAGTLHVGLARLMQMPKPLVTLVNGAAAGAGFGMAVCGDFVLAARSATFTPAYGAIGLTPDGGITWLLPRLVGLRRAQDILIGNRRIKAEEAEAIGLVTRVVDDEALLAEGKALAADLASRAVTALGHTRALLLESWGNGLEAQLDRETHQISTAAGAAEAKEGIRAFKAREKPDFPGAG